MKTARLLICALGLFAGMAHAQTATPADAKTKPSAAAASPAAAANPAAVKPAVAANPAAMAKPAAAANPAPAKPAATGSEAATGSADAGTKKKEKASRSKRVWINLDSKVYHCPDSAHWGKTKNGRYDSEPNAKAAGATPSGNKPCFE